MPASPLRRRCTTSIHGRGAALRAEAAEGLLPIPGAPFPLAAALAEEEGFPAIYLSGAALSAGIFAVPDIGLIDLEQLALHTERMASAVDLPLVVDADTGFGGPREVEACVQRLEAAGAAAIQLEDQRIPKRCGHLPGKELVDTAEMCDKLAAAAAGRRDPSTVIIARSDARGVEGLDAMLARLEAYRAAGGDWLFPEALASEEEFATVGRAFTCPLLANMTEFGAGPLLTQEALAACGFAAVLYPVTLLRVAMKAMEAALRVIADEESQASLLDLMQSRQELYDLLTYDPAAADRWGVPLEEIDR